MMTGSKKESPHSLIEIWDSSLLTKANVNLILLYFIQDSIQKRERESIALFVELKMTNLNKAASQSNRKHTLLKYFTYCIGF